MALPVLFTTKIIYDSASSDASYVAYCPELDVSSCGPTVLKARENLHEAIELTLNEAVKDKTLRDLLQLAGYQRVGRKLTAPQVSFEQTYFSLPDKMKSEFQWLT